MARRRTLKKLLARIAIAGGMAVLADYLFDIGNFGAFVVGMGTGFFLSRLQESTGDTPETRDERDPRRDGQAES